MLFVYSFYGFVLFLGYHPLVLWQLYVVPGIILGAACKANALTLVLSPLSLQETILFGWFLFVFYFGTTPSGTL